MKEGKISVAGAAPDFSFTLARVAVAQICQSLGYKGAQRPALEALTDIAIRYLKAAGKLTAESASSSGRTESNIFDIIAALEELTSVQGFDGSWRVRSRSLCRSGVIKDLIRFVKYMDETPFAHPLPPMRSCTESGMDLKNRRYSEGRLKHVPAWLPAVEWKEETDEREREREVKWECLGRGEKRGEANLECKKLKRENTDQVWAKRERVRFKMGHSRNVE